MLDAMLWFFSSGSNRILSKSKMFLVLYSCEYLSKFYIIYQSTYFIEYFMQDNCKYQRIKKIHQVLEKITRIDQKLKNSLYLVITGIIIYKSILHINLHILFISFSRQIKKCKNYQHPTSTSRVTHKNVLLFYLNCFLLVTHLNLEQLEKCN